MHSDAAKVTVGKRGENLMCGLFGRRGGEEILGTFPPLIKRPAKSRTDLICGEKKKDVEQGDDSDANLKRVTPQHSPRLRHKLLKSERDQNLRQEKKANVGAW